MAEEINAPKMIVEKFEPKDIIAYITPMVGSVVKDFAMAVENNNMSRVALDASSLTQVYNILRELDIKLNGDKPTTVL